MTTTRRGLVDHPALLPAGLWAEGDWRDQPRSTRDWVIDVAFFLLALGGLPLPFTGADPSVVTDASTAVVAVDLALGVVVAASLWLRRRHPVPVAILAVLVTPFSTAAGVGLLLVLFSTVLHVRPRLSATIGAAFGLGTQLLPLVRPQHASYLAFTAVNVVSIVVVVAWSLFVRARRQLVLSLRDRAERAEAEQRLLAEQAKLAERTRIAREMHDVLAHRISLIALHAGGLEVNGTLPDDQRREAAALIRSTARTALEELRGVIGVLRSDPAVSDASDEAGVVVGLGSGPAPVPPPQPRLTDVARLVEESRAAGAKVSLTFEVEDADDAPAAVGRDVYRVVQEALTNVTKHARGTATDVRIVGGPAQGLQVSVRNRLPVGGSGSMLPGAGAGLVGLAERVGLAGGTLAHGPVGEVFEVAVDLPWEER